MQENTSKRDRLAVQRNELANERTVLAYIRTSISFVGFGVFIAKLFPQTTYFIIGLALILIGLVVLFIGYRSYKKHNKKI